MCIVATKATFLDCPLCNVLSTAQVDCRPWCRHHTEIQVVPVFRRYSRGNPMGMPRPANGDLIISRAVGTMNKGSDRYGEWLVWGPEHGALPVFRLPRDGSIHMDVGHPMGVGWHVGEEDQGQDSPNGKPLPPDPSMSHTCSNRYATFLCTTNFHPSTGAPAYCPGSLPDTGITPVPDVADISGSSLVHHVRRIT